MIGWNEITQTDVPEMMSTKDRSGEDSFSGFKYSKDCTPQELEEQLRKIDERFGGRDNAKKFLEGVKEMKTPSDLLEAWNQVKDEAEERRRKKDVIRGRIILAVIIAFGALLLTYPKLKKWWREKETTGLINSLSTSPIPSREL